VGIKKCFYVFVDGAATFDRNPFGRQTFGRQTEDKKRLVNHLTIWWVNFTNICGEKAWQL
jgi:hypothetical protein